jgi:hypothetical protein
MHSKQGSGEQHRIEASRQLGSNLRTTDEQKRVTQAPTLSQSLIQRARSTPTALLPADILALQRMAGNHAVQRLLTSPHQEEPGAGDPVTHSTPAPSGVLQRENEDEVPWVRPERNPPKPNHPVLGKNRVKPGPQWVSPQPTQAGTKKVLGLKDKRVKFGTETVSKEELFDWDKNQLKGLTKIGQGAFGDVYKTNLAQGDPTAYKQAKQLPFSTVNPVDMLVNEYQMQKQFKGMPNIAQVEKLAIIKKQAPSNEEEMGMLMKYYPNGTLKTAAKELREARRTRKIKENEFYAILRKWTQALIRGVAAIEEAGIVHQDIKPDNVLLDENYEPQITDFGLARKRAKPNSIKKIGTNDIAGTLPYMPPELGMSPYSDAHDVYSLGRTIQDLAEENMWQGRGQVPPILNGKKGKLSTDDKNYKQFVEKVTSDRKERPSAKDLLENKLDLPFLKGEPVFKMGRDYKTLMRLLV